MADIAFSRSTDAEERANAWTHGLGALLAVVGLVASLVVVEATGGGVARTLTVLVYGLTLVLTYVASTGFHLAARHRSRSVWRLLDHASIYTLIAGTYTPIMLVAVGGAWGWWIFGVVWACAVAGVTAKFLLVGRFDAFARFDTLLYLAMGWLALVAIVPIWNALDAASMGWLVAGGVAYSLGCVFFLWNTLRHNHAIWHLFVLAGSACHFAAVWLAVVRGDA